MTETKESPDVDGELGLDPDLPEGFDPDQFDADDEGDEK